MNFSLVNAHFLFNAVVPKLKHNKYDESQTFK
jgi:hypothetical protein